MANAKIKIVVEGAHIIPGNLVFIGEHLIRQHKIPTRSPLTLRFGAANQTIKASSVFRTDDFRISETMAARLGLHHGAQLSLKYKPASRTIVIGPLIGVMVSQIYPHIPDRPFGSITSFCKELVDACRLYGGFVYFFTAHDITQNKEQLEGWYYDDGWRKTTFPTPDVIYNRLTTRKLENKPSVQHFLKEVKSRFGTAVFNEKYLDKTDVFDALLRDPNQLRYLPESHLCNNYRIFKTMLGKYPVVFLKPVTGSLGKGIVRISRNGARSFSCQLAGLNGLLHQQFNSLAGLFSALSGKLNKRRYQIQQGLDLIEVSGRPVDFRALVQRDGQGAWTVTSVVARIAGYNHFVSNLARGGTLCRVKDALAKSNLQPALRRTVYANMRKAALDIANGIASQIKGHFGELGVDLAVDTNGKVWLIEVNSKPSKHDGTPLAEGAVRPSAKLTVQYARYLAGF